MRFHQIGNARYGAGSWRRAHSVWLCQPDGMCFYHAAKMRLGKRAGPVQGAPQVVSPRLQPTRCSMKIAILKERRPHETRVAATPETVKKLKALGAEEIVI